MDASIDEPSHVDALATFMGDALLQGLVMVVAVLVVYSSVSSLVREIQAIMDGDADAQNTGATADCSSSSPVSGDVCKMKGGFPLDNAESGAKTDLANARDTSVAAGAAGRGTGRPRVSSGGNGLKASRRLHMRAARLRAKVKTTATKYVVRTRSATTQTDPACLASPSSRVTSRSASPAAFGMGRRQVRGGPNDSAQDGYVWIDRTDL